MEQRCWACKSDLKSYQLICTNCDSWQNWRRYFNLSGATLSLILAILSVSTVAVPILTNTFSEKKAKLIVSGLGKVKLDLSNKKVPHYGIKLNIRNIGTEAAVISNPITCSLWAAYFLFPETPYIRFYIATSQATFIEANEQIELKYEINAQSIYDVDKLESLDAIDDLDNESYQSFCHLNYSSSKAYDPFENYLVFGFTEENAIFVLDDNDSASEISSKIAIEEGG